MAVAQQKRIQMLKALRRAQQNEIDTNTQYTNLIDNMPILYMKEQVIWDKEGISQTAFIWMSTAISNDVSCPNPR